LKSILDTSGIILVGFDHLASQFNPLVSLAREIVDIDDAGVNQYANYIAIRGVRVSAVNVSLQQLGIVAFDVL
jgi:hypothetical protein